jgi:hypothetical protein
MVSPAMAMQHRPMRMLEQGADGAVVSDGWSGYAVTGTVDSVTGSWVVPTATCVGTGVENTGASFWVGIDGYTSATVEQTGTDSDCSNGFPSYYAWYEFFPAAGVTIASITVQPGDVMTASVVYDGAEFTATITDENSNETFSITQARSGAKRNSAEWIAEDNSNLFTDFDQVLFGQDEMGVAPTCKASVGGKTTGIGGFSSYHAIFTAGSKKGSFSAVPSALYPDGGSFSVQRD